MAMFGLNKLQSVLVFGHAKDRKKVKLDEILRFLSNQNRTLTNDFKLFYLHGAKSV